MFPDSQRGLPIQQMDETEKQILYIADQLLSTCNEHLHMQQYYPSQRAAAAITIARKKLEITPYWSAMLPAVSGISLASAEPCIHDMYALVPMHCLPSFSPVSVHRPLSSDSGIFSPGFQNTNNTSHNTSYNTKKNTDTMAADSMDDSLELDWPVSLSGQWPDVPSAALSPVEPVTTAPQTVGWSGQAGWIMNTPWI